MNKIIDKIEKNSIEELRVTLQEWKSQVYCDIRIFVKDKDGGDKPTVKGITINIDILSELRKAIDKALSEIELEDSKGIGKESNAI